MNHLLSRKLVMGMFSLAAVAASGKLGLSDTAIYVLGAVALACSGAQAVADILKAWAEGRPFTLETRSCEPSAQ